MHTHLHAHAHTHTLAHTTKYPFLLTSEHCLTVEKFIMLENVYFDLKRVLYRNKDVTLSVIGVMNYRGLGFRKLTKKAPDDFAE